MRVDPALGCGSKGRPGNVRQSEKGDIVRPNKKIRFKNLLKQKNNIFSYKCNVNGKASSLRSLLPFSVVVQ
jgi:hypothetical protein